MEFHLILKISSPILVQFWEKTEAKDTVKTVVEQHIVTFWAPGAGIKFPGVNPQTALHLFNVGARILYYYRIIKLLRLRLPRACPKRQWPRQTG